MDLPYGSLEESLAIRAWRKAERIELYRTIALCTAAANPDKAQEALRKLLEEQFPEIAKEREEAVGRAMDIMEKEKEKSYKVAPVGSSFDKGSFARMRNTLKQRKRPGRVS